MYVDPKYTIEPIIDFINDALCDIDGNPIPGDELIDLLKKTHHKDECFYLGEMRIDEIHTSSLHQNAILDYFNKGINWDAVSIDFIYENHRSTYIKDYEIYLKMVWLAHDYLCNNGFDHPIGVHWNPRGQKFVVHPGVIRYSVVQLFSRKFYGYYWATRGYAPGFTEYMRKVPSEEMLKDKAFFVVPDHGTFIPHIGYDFWRIFPNAKEVHTRLQKAFLVDHVKINSNHDLSHFMAERFLSNTNASIQIEFKNEPDHNTTCKALVVMNFPYREIISDDFTIVKTFDEGKFVKKSNNNIRL